MSGHRRARLTDYAAQRDENSSESVWGHGTNRRVVRKARASLDLKARKDAGEKIDANSFKKHRNGVFRLVQLLTQEAVTLFASFRADLKRFVESMADEDVDPATYKVENMTRNEALATLKTVFGL